ncbi:MAG: CoA transferase [Rhodospirillaceae bacterium]|nr:CoA transferase [Rhodospirillaceae bacterium]
MTGPLHGCRVLDLGIITAGAATSALLADLGAEVIKVESSTYRDPFRIWSSRDPNDAAGGMPPYFRATNRNKVGISIDLKKDEGREVFLRLAGQSDIVVENFRRGVLDRLKLGYPVLESAKPGIILASISSQGETGPDAGYVSYGTTLEAVAGLAWRTGYAGDEPVVSGRDLNYPDQVAAIFAAGMIVTAWRSRLETGTGSHLDLSQRELTSFLSGEAFADPDEETPRQGNAQPPHHYLQECFRAADGVWVAVTVDGDQVASLDRAVPGTGAPEARLRTWVAGRSAQQGADDLTAAGIAAAVVLDGTGMMAHAGNLWSTAMLRLDEGALVKGFPFQLDAMPLRIVRDAPKAGADTAEVLARVGGYSEAEIADFAGRGVIEIA